MITQSLSYIGDEAESTVKRYNADVVFFSCRGLSMNGMLTDNSIEENNLRKVMLNHARKRVLLCDSSKVDQMYLNNVCHLSDVDEIVCESEIPEQLQEMTR